MKRFTFLSCLFLFTVISFGQDKTWKREDINQDGVKDSITIYYDGGSGFGGWWIEMIDGKTKTRYEMDTWACFCRTKKFILIPPVFLEKGNDLFLARAKTELIGADALSSDPALAWILSGSMHTTRALLDSGMFGYGFQFEPAWMNFKPMHSSYYLPLSPDSLVKLYRTDGELYDEPDKVNWQGGVIMNGEILGTYPETPDFKSGDYEYYCSAHSVIVKNLQSGLWSYAFVTDSDLTGAPDKLRWSSIKEIWAEGNYLLIRHSRLPESEDSFFVLNVLNGKCALPRFTCDGQDDVKLSDGVFSVAQERIISLKELTDALESFIAG